MNMRASPPNYEFNSADLAQAEVTSQEVAQIILEKNQTGVDPLVMLAAILKAQRPRNARYTPTGFGLAAWNIQQIFTQNPTRSWVLIQNTGGGDLLLLFEPGNPAIQDFSGAADSQAYLTNAQLRALRVVSGGYFEAIIPPVNPITIFTLGTGTEGVAIEGS